MLDCPKNAAWFDDLPGSEEYWVKPDKKVSELISANDLPDVPKKRERRQHKQANQEVNITNINDEIKLQKFQISKM
ncbi:hypothetical protein D3C78_1448110 [compost metagenome]